MKHSQKNTPVARDNLISSRHIPQSLGLSAVLAERGYGYLSDNHGNTLIGHELITTASGEVRCYDLTEADWEKLVHIIDPDARAADNAMRDDGKVPVRDGRLSPLEVLSREFQHANAHFTVLPGTIAKASKLHR